MIRVIVMTLEHSSSLTPSLYLHMIFLCPFPSHCLFSITYLILISSWIEFSGFSTKTKEYMAKDKHASQILPTVPFFPSS
jgi:ABC-type microcin C transport system permease subunit YejE